ncbi:hypothetical protein [Streptomyces sp. NPDC001880]
MAASDTLDVNLDGAWASPVGEPGAYVERPGFQHGGIGVAACWNGGARAVARTFLSASRKWGLGPHALAHLGAAVDARLAAVDALLDGAAAAVAADLAGPRCNRRTHGGFGDFLRDLGALPG